MLDSSLVFDGTLNPTAGVAITASRVSTNVIDWMTGRDMGAGAFLSVHVAVLEAFATLTSLAVNLEVCDTVGGTYLNILQGEVVPVAQLIVGVPMFRYGFPLNQVLNATAGVLKTPGRFCRLNYTVAGSNATTGKVFSYLAPVHDRQQVFNYPENFATH